MLSTRPVLLLVLLLTFSQHCATVHIASECCFDYVKSPLRSDVLKDFYKTPNDCFYSGIVFETKKGTKVCANPKTRWVEKAIEKLLKRKRSHVS